MSIKEIDFNRINSIFKLKLIYRIGIDGGFFSEYNNMIITMHYCIMNKIRFVLFSEKANFSNSNGWTEFFFPFSEVDNNNMNLLFNQRYEKPIVRGKKNKIAYLIFQIHLLLNNIDFLTYDIFHKARNQSLTYNHENKELGLNSSLQENCRIISDYVWRYKPEIQNEIDILIEELHLSKQFVGFHIRRGDKEREANFIALNEYIRIAEINSSLKNAFIATDDYTVVEEFKRDFPKWNVFTLTKPTNRGYDQYVFNKITTEQKRTEMIELFATIEILSKSELFVGTMSSNIGMYMGWRMPKEKCIGVDFNEWKIW